MLNKIKFIFILLLNVFPLLWKGAGGEIFSQNYPVQITTQLQSPFSGYIPDYATPGNQNLKLLVLFTDFTKPSYNIKLKIKISGQNINIQSKGYYYAGPFTVQPGIPIEISGNDLNGLLNNNNLDFSGISLQQYNQQKVLPEGAYTICFTAYDYNNPSQIQVSNESCTLGWMILSDPPFLNLPMCGSTTLTSNPQNIIFQWTPMNLTSPNSAYTTLYDFELFEIIPGTQSAGNILQTLPPIYSVTTPLTVINYGITEPVLNIGMQYVWRVKARDITGRDLFKNQGYSQPCTFYYGSVVSQIDSSTLKLNLKGNVVTHRVLQYSWDSISVFTSYKLEYRKLGGTNWFPVTTNERGTVVNNLEPQNSYEARVKGIYSEGEGPWSNTVTLTTPEKPVISCGQGISINSSATFKPLTNGKTGQLWDIGQFEMLVTQLDNPNNVNGSYSGYGKIEIPFMLNMNLTGKFNNILVNETMEVVQGKVEIVTSGYNGANIVNLDSLLAVINGWFDEFNTTHDTTTFANTYSSNIGSLCSVSPLVELLNDCSAAAIVNYLQNGDSNSINDLQNATNQAAGNSNSQVPCDPAKVAPNLKLLAQQSIPCSNSFDTQFEPYRNMPELLKALCLQERVNIIKCLIQYSDDEDQEGIIALINTTPKEQLPALFNELKLNGSKLLKDLIAGVSGSEFNVLMDALITKVIEWKGIPSFNASTLSNLISNKKLVAFNQWNANNQTFTSNGYYTLFVRENFNLCCEYTLATDPFSFVLIRFDADFSIQTAGRVDSYPEGTWLIAPAIILPKIINEGDNRVLHYAADVTGLFFGYTELKLAIQGGKSLAIALLDIGISATDMSINITLIDELNKTENGQATINAWNTFAMCYGLARTSPALFSAAKNYYINAKVYLLKPHVLNAQLEQQLQKTINEAKAIIQEKGANELTTAENEILLITNSTDNLATLLSKWDNLTIPQTKTLYLKLLKSEVQGSIQNVSQATILSEINSSNSLINPYNFAHPINDIVLNHEGLFVRVHNFNNPNRPWLIAIEDFRSFISQDDMIKKLALPILDNNGNIIKPTEISLVKLPIGTKVRKSVARPQDWPGQAHQPGGSIQYEIRENLNIPKAWFKPMGNISDYIN